MSTATSNGDGTSTTLLSPKSSKRKVSMRPSRAEAAFPLLDYQRPASDPLGRSCAMSVTMPPNARRACSVILSQKLFGFETEPDILRWCIENGLNELKRRSKNKELVSEVNILNAWTSAAAKELELALYRGHFENLAKSIDTLVESGHQPKAQALAEQIWRDLDQLDDPYWRKLFREMAKKKLDLVKKVGERMERDRKRISRRERDREREAAD